MKLSGTQLQEMIKKIIKEQLEALNSKKQPPPVPPNAREASQKSSEASQNISSTPPAKPKGMAPGLPLDAGIKKGEKVPASANVAMLKKAPPGTSPTVESKTNEKSLEDIAFKLKQYAKMHYNEDGWDYLVETFEINEIVEELEKKNISTLPKAIKHFHKWMKLLDNRRKDVESEIFETVEPDKFLYLAKKVAKHAKENYAVGSGWDSIIKHWNVNEIAKYLKKYGIKDTETAINRFTEIAEFWRNRTQPEDLTGHEEERDNLQKHLNALWNSIDADKADLIDRLTKETGEEVRFNPATGASFSGKEREYSEVLLRWLKKHNEILKKKEKPAQ